ncbi:MAG: DUF6471 domain-containing protein [Hyphomonadaceae bacterium]
MDDKDWAKHAKNVLRSELTRQGVTVRELARRLDQDDKILANKISRGKFTAAFMFQCLDAIGVSEVRV